MKKFWILSRAFLALAAVALTACGEKEQSELNLSDLGGTATIQGVVTYDSGAATISGATISSNLQAAEGVTVMVKLAYSEITSGSNGDVVYTGVTNSAGEYSIEADIKAIGSVDVTVEIAPFYKDYNVLSNGNIVTVEDAYFEGTTETKSLSADMPAYIVNIEASTQDGIDASAMTTDVLFGVNASMYVESYNNEALMIASAISSKLADYDGGVIKVTFSNSQDGRSISYQITTDSDGYAELSTKVYDSWDLNDVTVSYELVPEFKSNDFVHYYYDSEATDVTDRKTQSLDGYYEDASSPRTASISSLVTNASYGTTRTKSSLTVTFYPSADEVIYGVDNTTGYITGINPLGWSTIR